ncbi:LOW QUALITY PROTEIN: endosomal transmembrane epsin interactor 1 [Leptosomus discolor]
MGRGGVVRSCSQESPEGGGRAAALGPGGASLMPTTGVAPAPPGRATGGQASVPAGRGARRGDQPAACRGGHPEPVASAATSPPAEQGGEGSAAPREVGARVSQHRGGGEPGPATGERPPPPPPMSLPLAVPSTCCPAHGLTPLPQAAAAAAADPSLPLLNSPGCSLGLPQDPNPRSAAPAPGAVRVPACLLVWLALTEIILGAALVTLNSGSVALSSAPQVKSSCPFWAGSSVILSGILGLVIRKSSMKVLTKLFFLLSVVCVLLNLAGYAVASRDIRFVSRASKCNLVDVGENKICFCCKEFSGAECTEETALKLYHVKSCSSTLHLLKKVLIALCVLSALSTTVSLVVVAQRYWHIITARRSCVDESQIEDQNSILDPDDFVPPVPPPSYFATFCSYTPQMSCRMPDSDVIPLTRIYGGQIKAFEMLCPLDPPPAYKAQWKQNSSEQEGVVQKIIVDDVDLGEVSDRQASQGKEIPESSSRVSLSPSDASRLPAEVVHKGVFNLLQRQSGSDPVLHCRLLQGLVLSCEDSMQTEVKPQLCSITLWKSLKIRALRGRPQSLIDGKSYADTERPVLWILEQSSCSMNPDVHELVENIKSVLKSDEKHVAEAITSATFLEQIPIKQYLHAVSLSVRVLPFRQHPGLPYLESWGDLSTFTTDEDQAAERRSRAKQEWPYSHIGVVRETVL